jgi:hypothetical protein
MRRLEGEEDRTPEPKRTNSSDQRSMDPHSACKRNLLGFGINPADWFRNGDDEAVYNQARQKLLFEYNSYKNSRKIP